MGLYVSTTVGTVPISQVTKSDDPLSIQVFLILIVMGSLKPNPCKFVTHFAQLEPTPKRKPKVGVSESWTSTLEWFNPQPKGLLKGSWDLAVGGIV